MRISFYYEQDVNRELVFKVTQLLKDLPSTLFHFDDYAETAAANNHVLESPDYDTSGNKWYEKYYNKFRSYKFDNSDIIIHFHNNNPDEYYSHVGIGKTKEQRIITVATSDETWHFIENKEFAIVHEILSVIPLALAIKTSKEFENKKADLKTHKVPILEKTWIAKEAEVDPLLKKIFKKDILLPAKLIVELNIKSADFSLAYINYVLQEGAVSEYIFRDIVVCLKDLAKRYSNVGKLGLDEQKASKMIVDFSSRTLFFPDYKKEITLPSQLFTIYCTYLIAGTRITYPQLIKERETINNIYHMFRDADIYELFSENENANRNFRSAKSKMNSEIKNSISKNPKIQAKYIIEEYEITPDTEYCFTEESKKSLSGIIPRKLDCKINFKNINFCNFTKW
jgi:hypothetical protein